MTEVHWGVDGRTHRVGPNGQTLCKTMIDYSRPPENRFISGCQVCDIVSIDVDARGGVASGRALVISLAAVLIVGLLIWAVVT